MGQAIFDRLGHESSEQSLVHSLDRFGVREGTRPLDAPLMVQATRLALGRLNLYQWVLFIGHHELRHRGQIRATLSS